MLLHVIFDMKKKKRDSLVPIFYTLMFFMPQSKCLCLMVVT